VDCPTSSETFVAVGTVIVGSADTVNTTAELMRETPLESATVTAIEYVLVPTAVGVHVKVARSEEVQPVGRPVHE
jgi:hypothetical protein